jgi:hypothetical protein
VSTSTSPRALRIELEPANGTPEPWDTWLLGNPEGEQYLHVLVVTDDEPAKARLLGSVRVAVEPTGDQRHDCLHAILAASEALSERRAVIELPGEPV